MSDMEQTEHYAVQLILDGQESWYGADAPGFDERTAYDTMFTLLVEHANRHHPFTRQITVSMMKKTDEGWEQHQHLQFTNTPVVHQHRAA